MKTYEEMAESVLSRRDAYIAKRKKQVKVFASGIICLAVIVGIGFGVSGGLNSTEPSTSDLGHSDNSSVYVNKEGIRINEIDTTMQPSLKLDMDVKFENYTTNGITKFKNEDMNKDFMKNLGVSYNEFRKMIPEFYSVNSFYATLAGNGSGKYVFHEYVMELNDCEYGGSIRLAFCRNGKPLRDYLYLCDDPMYSEINGEKLVISHWENTYATEFTHNGISYDIESTGVRLDDYIILLCSILK